MTAHREHHPRRVHPTQSTGNCLHTVDPHDPSPAQTLEAAPADTRTEMSKRSSARSSQCDSKLRTNNLRAADNSSARVYPHMLPAAGRASDS